MTRARDLGIVIGNGTPGPNNAITDVAGVRVGYSTLIQGDDVRTGVTVILPFRGQEALFAGFHRLNGNGEMTGIHYIEEMGLLTSPIAITNTHSVGTVHEALVAHSVRTGQESQGFASWALPVVAETWDGRLNDINGFHVKREHVDQAIASARAGAVEEGNVGGGTGMICHGFKGGTGTASRLAGSYTVGVLVQANHGQRRRLQINGIPVGERVPPSLVPLPSPRSSGEGSIIVVVATDAPLLPFQCRRLAQRAALGIGRTGGLGADSSGDLILAFATGNQVNPDAVTPTVPVEMLQNARMDPLFEAVVEATEEAIVNALVAAETMTGKDGTTAYALPRDQILSIMDR
jgi:D-aminopeptidase